MSEPLCHALMTCEAIILDRFTGNWSLMGVSQSVQGAQFPMVLPKLSCFAVFSDAGGTVDWAFRVLDPDLNEVSVLHGPKLESVERSDVQQIGCVFRAMVLPKPGRYSVEFMIDGRTLQSSRLEVSRAPVLPPA